MPRITHAADAHIMDPGHPNYEESLKGLSDMVDAFLETESDYLAISGDLFDRGTPKPESVARVKEIFRPVPDDRVIISGGNHEQQGVFSNHRNPIDAYLAQDSWCRASVDGQPKTVEVDGFHFLVVPWARVAGSSQVQSTEEYLRNQIAELANELEGQPSMLMGHIALEEVSFSHPERRGSEVSMMTTMSEALVGADFLDSLPISTWRLGHIHKRQDLGSQGGGYVGSTYKVTFGERHERKGFDIIDVDDKGHVSLDFHERRGRELVQLNLVDEPRGLRNLVETLRSGDVVRLIEDPDARRTETQEKYISELGRMGVDLQYRNLVKEVVQKVYLSGLNTESSPLDAMRQFINSDDSMEPETASRRMNRFSDILTRVNEGD